MPHEHDHARPADRARISERIVERAKALGFALVGVIPVHETDHAREYRDWIAAGRHGEMDYLARNIDLREDPSGLLHGARSIICVADQYADRRPLSTDQPGSAPGDTDSPRGRVARYARGDDYHRVMKKRLHELADALRSEHPGAEFRAFVDTAPLLEREHAARAGLGWIGKHTLLIHPRRGSWLLLGGLLTTLELVPPRIQRPEPDHCGTCTRCIDACPTDAITPYSVDATKCISYLTIEHRSKIDPRFHAAMGDWIYGCDICQDVCPHNSPRYGDIPTGRAHPAYTEKRTSFDLLEVLGWTEDDRRAAFQRSAMKRASLDMIKRNAIIAAGNAIRELDHPELRAMITHLASDREESGQVRDVARYVLNRPERDGRSATPTPADNQADDRAE